MTPDVIFSCRKAWILPEKSVIILGKSGRDFGRRRVNEGVIWGEEECDFNLNRRGLCCARPGESLPGKKRAFSPTLAVI